MRGHDHTGRAGPVGAPRDGPQIAGIGDAVEHDQQRLLRRGQLVRIGVRIRGYERQNPLVIPGFGSLGELTLRLLLRAELGQPVLRLDRTLGGPHLEHFPAPSQRLAHRPAPVDELRRHDLTRS